MGEISRSVSGRICSFLLSFVLVAGPAFQAVPAFASSEDTMGAAATSEPIVSQPPTQTAESTVTIDGDQPEGPPTLLEELVDRRTETATHWRYSDGSVRVELSQNPVRFKDGDDEWAPVVTALVPAEESGAVQAASTEMATTFGVQRSGEAPVSLATDDFEVGIDYLGAAEQAKIVLGDTTRYLGIEPGADLEYQARHNGIKETVIISNADAPTNYTFELALDGLELRCGFDGGYGLYRPDATEPELVLGSLIVFDSSVNAAGDPAYCEEATMDVVAVGENTARVTYDLPEAWLSAPERVFPVKVDPTITRPTELDTFVSSKYPDTKYDSSDELKCGYYDSTTGHNRAYVRFDTSSIPVTAYVADTNFAIRQFHQYYTNTETRTYVGRLIKTFSVNTTWNTQSSVVGNHDPVADMRRGKDVTGRDLTINWDVDDIVQTWVTTPSANKGFLLYQSETSSQNTTHWRKFRSKEYSTSSQRPSLEVWYLEPAGGSSSANKTSVREGETIALTGQVNTYKPEDVNVIELEVKDDAGVSHGKFRWSTNAQKSTSGWETGKACSGAAGGWVTKSTNSSSQIGDWSATSSITAQENIKITFTYTIPLTYSTANVAGNRIVYRFSMGPTDDANRITRDWAHASGRWTVLNDSAPVANATAPATAFAGVPVQFSSAGSSDDVGITSYAWDFDNNGTTDSIAANPTYQYASPGTKTWKLTVKDKWNQSATKTGSITVNAGQPLPPQQVGIDASASDWFVETDADGDGVADNPNDTDGAGRGAVTLTWASATEPTHGYDVYLFDGATYRKVAELGPAATEWTSSGAGVYPSDSSIVSRATELAAGQNPFVGGGLDLRDDPRALYAATPGTDVDDIGAYFFKVVPWILGSGAGRISEAPTSTVVFDNRTRGFNDDVRHAPYPIGELAGHQTEYLADTGALRQTVTDLSIASWGPEAAVSRVYDSRSVTQGSFGPGWRFNFEKHIDTSTVTFFDEAGDPHRFIDVGSTYQAPRGFDAEMTRELVGASLGYRLTYTGGLSALFDAGGVLLEETDSNGNRVRYDRSVPSQLSIWAANGQRIVVALRADGTVASATHTTDDGTRSVTYSTLTTQQQNTTAYNTCTYHPNTEDERTIRYDYGITDTYGVFYLTDMKVLEVPKARWHFEAWPRLTDWYQDGVHMGMIYGSTIQRAGSFYPEHWNGWLEGQVFEEFEVNPTGTMKRMSRRHGLDDTTLWTEYGYDRHNRTSVVIDPLGHSDKTLLDARGNTVLEIDKDGNQTRHIIGAVGGARDRVVESIDPRGARTLRTYDISGNMLTELTEVEPGTFASTTWSYDADGRGLVASETRAIDAQDSVVTLYDDFADNGEPQLVSRPGIVLEPGGSETALTERTDYDAFGLVTNRTDALDIVTETNEYTPAGYLKRSTDATGTSTVYTVDPMGRTTESYRIDRDGDRVERVVYESDPQGITKKEKHYDGDTLVYTITNVIDVFGTLKTSEHSIEGKTVYWTDARGNNRFVWGPKAVERAGGTITGSTNQQWATRNTYDAADRLTSSVAADAESSQETRNTYTPGGSLSKVTEPDGSWVAYVYDRSGNKIKETQAKEGAGQVVNTFEYDLAGNLTKETKAVGTDEQTDTAYAYDLLGRQRSATLTSPSTKTYNRLGWVLSETDFDGIVTTRVYDEAGRTTSESVGGKITSTVFDEMGQVLSRTDPASKTVSYRYDTFGRVVDEAHTSQAGSTIKRTETAYDAMSRTVATTQTPSGVITRSSYPAGSMKASESQFAYGDLSGLILYDELSRETSRSIQAHGLSSSRQTTYDLSDRPVGWVTDGRVSSAAYDGAGKVTAQDGLGWGAGGADYVYDPDTGRKVSEDLALAYPGQTYTNSYAYTDAGRLQSVATGGLNTAYSFDERGNLTGIAPSSGTATTLTYDANDRLTSATTGSSQTVYGYDELGRRESQGPAATPSAVGYTYDDASRMTGYTNGSVSAAYSYDALGQRTRSVLTQGSVTTTLTSTYDGLSLLSQSALRSDGATWTITYAYSTSGRPHAAIYAGTDAGSPTLIHLITNDRGDVVELLDADGEAFAAYRYDAWGNPMSGGTETRAISDSIDAALAAAIADRQSLRYAGYAYDTHSGLYYCSQRYYDPATGQFLTKDPARDDGEESAYQYCGGDPVGSVDPGGLHRSRFGGHWHPLGGISIGYRQLRLEFRRKGNSWEARYVTYRWFGYNGLSIHVYTIIWAKADRGFLAGVAGAATAVAGSVTSWRSDRGGYVARRFVTAKSKWFPASRLR